MNAWVAWRLNPEDLGKLGNSKIFPEIIKIDDECTVGYLKTNIGNVLYRKTVKCTVMYSKTFHS